MKQQNHPQGTGSRHNDDVGRLFDKLGSGGAGLYQDFEPNRLPPASAVAVQPDSGSPAGMPSSPAPPPPPLASVRALREPAAAPSPSPTVAAAAAGMAGAEAPTPLDELFQRLLQAEIPAPSSGVLKRMFGR